MAKDGVCHVPTATLRVLFVAAALAVAFLYTLPAEANSPAPFSRPRGLLPGALVERPSPVIVEREDLDIDCTGGVEHPPCRFVATYHLRNPAANDEELLGAFYVAEARPYDPEHELPPPPLPDVAIAFEGKDAQTEATEEQLARMDRIVGGDPGVKAQLESNGGLTLNRVPYRFTIAAGARASLVFSGPLNAVSYADEGGYSGFILPAIEARHGFLGPNKSTDFAEGCDDFLYLVSPLANWAGDPRVHVRIRHEERANFDGKDLHFASARTGDVVTESIVLDAKRRQNLRFGFSFGHLLHHGGPLLGIGLRFGRAELHTRFGYEFGIGKSLFVSGVVDTNFDDYLTPAVTIDAATPNLVFVFPALSFGVGATTQFRKDAATRVGIRTQFGLSWLFFALSFPIDIYPVASSSGSHVEGGFLATISF